MRRSWPNARSSGCRLRSVTQDSRQALSSLLRRAFVCQGPPLPANFRGGSRLSRARILWVYTRTQDDWAGRELTSPVQARGPERSSTTVLYCSRGLLSGSRLTSSHHGRERVPVTLCHCTWAGMVPRGAHPLSAGPSLGLGCLSAWTSVGGGCAYACRRVRGRTSARTNGPERAAYPVQTTTDQRSMAVTQPRTSRHNSGKRSSQRHNPRDDQITPLVRTNSPCDVVTHHRRSRHNVTFPPRQLPQRDTTRESWSVYHDHTI